VACKLHSLNMQWSEEKKQSYIRHAIREYNIHKTLVHPHIVRLWDIFEIDHNTFCTVLEYCSGMPCCCNKIVQAKETCIFLCAIINVCLACMDFDVSISYVSMDFNAKSLV
jgi:hypothetical protein